MMKILYIFGFLLLINLTNTYQKYRSIENVNNQDPEEISIKIK